MSDEWRLLDDPPAASMFAGEPRQRPGTGALASPLGGPFDLRAERLLRGGLAEPVDVEPVVGAHEQRLVGKKGDLVAIRRRTRHHRGRAVLLRGGVLPAGDPDAGDETS